ncbi:MAG: uracil-DNA glycosylase [Verrucomicrobia bacterium]|nr:uracil-DNA glycosylase [Verrucomicrobiota bacterium]
MAEALQVLLRATADWLQLEQRRGIHSIVVNEELLRSVAHSGGIHPQAQPVRHSFKEPVTMDSKSPKSRKITIGLETSPEVSPAQNPIRRPASARLDDMEMLSREVLPCQLCPHLAQSRKQVVFGHGNLNAALMFIGEAPGMEEDEQGLPFVGKAGQLLNRMIKAMGLDREDVYIANVLKCRPDTPGQAYGNRKPTPEEMERCNPYLLRQVEIIQPRVIVALGATALQGLFGNPNESITRSRGKWRSFRDIPLMPTYHPSYLLHKESVPDQAMIEKRKVWEDMLSVMEKLDIPISAKQRGYFSQ